MKPFTEIVRGQAIKEMGIYLLKPEVISFLKFFQGDGPCFRHEQNIVVEIVTFNLLPGFIPRFIATPFDLMLRTKSSSLFKVRS